MSWFRVDDGFHNHPKVMQAGTPAAGLFIRCGSYAAQHLTDGFVPDDVVKTYGTRAMVTRLVDAGLFVRVPGGYKIHDYLDWNPSREKVLAEREAARVRQARKRRDANGQFVGSHGVTSPELRSMSRPPRPEGLPALRGGQPQSRLSVVNGFTE